LRASRSSRSRRAAAVLLLAAACSAAAAGAQSSVEPRRGDNFLKPVVLSAFRDPEPFPEREMRLAADTTRYTIQDDLYSPPQRGGPREPTRCAGASYGNTLWVVFHSDRFGSMEIAASGSFDPVIRVVPFDRPGNPVPDLRRDSCHNEGAGSAEHASRNVEPEQWYAVQFGGAAAPQGGPLDVSLQLQPAPEVSGRASLAWRRRPLRITRLRVERVGERESLRLDCTKGACRDRTVKPGATTVELLRDRRVRRGATIELRVTAPGHVGRYYRWKARRRQVSAAAEGCLEPGSTRPRGSCG
jgi:hypothetical protein